jgi:hypothetical protein
MYLFGISAGGYTVFDVTMFDSHYFTAGGIFAAVITPDYDWIVQKATRKIPIAILYGGPRPIFHCCSGPEHAELACGQRASGKPDDFSQP